MQYFPHGFCLFSVLIIQFPESEIDFESIYVQRPASGSLSFG